MRISAKSDYAIRALLELASAPDGSLKAEELAERQQIPVNFLENIMTELRDLGFVRAHRGVHGGYWISHPTVPITLAEILEGIDGPLVTIHGSRPQEVVYPGHAQPLQGAWASAERALRSVLGRVTIDDLVHTVVESRALDRSVTR